MDKCREAFDSTINEHKTNIAKDMADFGEHKRIKKLHDDVDSEAHNYEWYFNKGAQSRQAEIKQLQAQINEMAEVGLGQESALREKDKWIEEALFQMRQQALSLKEDCDGYKDPVGICQSEGIDWCVKFLEKALRGDDHV